MGAVFSIFDHIILPTHSAEIFEHLKVWNKMKCDEECHLCDEVGEFAAHAQEVFWSSNFWSATTGDSGGGGIGISILLCLSDSSNLLQSLFGSKYLLERGLPGRYASCQRRRGQHVADK